MAKEKEEKKADSFQPDSSVRAGALAEKVFCALIASSYRTDNPGEVAKTARVYAKAFVESE
jgi:hypothetical protein